MKKKLSFTQWIGLFLILAGMILLAFFLKNPRALIGLIGLTCCGLGGVLSVPQYRTNKK